MRIYRTEASGPNLQAGFSLLEVLIALTISSIAFLAITSVSLGVIKGNNLSKKVSEGVILAQDTIEDIISQDTIWEAVSGGGFDLGSDMLLGTADDTIPTFYSNCSTANDTETDAATLFADPDHSYEIDASGVVQTDGNGSKLVESCQALTLSQDYLRQSWTIRDNEPVAGMKTLIVVVGWKEGSTDNYVKITTAIQGR